MDQFNFDNEFKYFNTVDRNTQTLANFVKMKNR